MPRIAAAFGMLVAVAFCIGFNIFRYPVVWDLVARSTQVSQSDEQPESTAVAQAESPYESEATSRVTASWEPTSVVPSVDSPVAEVKCAMPAWATDTERASADVVPEPKTEGISSGSSAPEAMTFVDTSIRARENQPIPMIDSGVPPAPVVEPAVTSSQADDVTSSQADVASAGTDGPKHEEPIAVRAASRYASEAEVTAEQSAASVPDDLEPVGPMVPVSEGVQADRGDQRSVQDVSDAASGSGETLVVVEKPVPGSEVVRRLPPIDEVHTVPAARDSAPALNGPIPFYPTTGVE